MQRTWLSRIDEILAILRASDVESFDRMAIERLFEIQRRTALLLMGAAGGIKSGRSYGVPRNTLIHYVEDIDNTEAQAVNLKQRALNQIEHESEKWKTVRVQAKGAIHFPISDEIAAASFSSLPHDVIVEPGKIIIYFDPKIPEDACQKLFALSKAFVNDLGSFLRLMEGKAVSKETAISDFISDLELPTL